MVDDARLTQIERSLAEIKESQEKVAQALLGSYDRQSVGLLEESRSLHREVEELKDARKLQEEQISSLLEFKRDTKKIVAAIAVAIPFIFELLKAGFMFIWNSVKSQ